jgi:hypothetical protein
VLVLAAATLIRLFAELAFGDINSAEIPAGAPDNILLITKIILLVVSLAFLFPQIYIGIKGLKLAKAPVGGKGHIIWGVILLAFSAFGSVSSVIALIGAGGVQKNLPALLNSLLEALVLYDYVKYSILVSKEN